MKLLLTSAGVTNASIEGELRRLVSRPTTKASIVVVLMAALAQPGDHGWLIADLHRLYGMRWGRFRLADLAVQPLEATWQQLSEADVVYFATGNAHQLARRLAAGPAGQGLAELSRSAVLVGSGKACAIFCRDTTRRLAALGDVDDQTTKQCEASDVSLLDAVSWFVQPQVDFDAWDPRPAELAGFPLFAIDDQTAIAVTDDDVAVVSEGRWRFLPGSTGEPANAER